MIEIWKDIKNYKHYQVSNLGRVKSVDRTKWNGKGSQVVVGIILKQMNNGKGYLQVSLSKGNVVKTKTVHRLVLSAFIPNIENKRTINHINGIKTDNRLENLEWATDLENSKHAWKNGLINTKKMIYQIKDGLVVATYKSLTEASKKTNIKMSNISYCCSGVRNNAGGYQWRYNKKEII